MDPAASLPREASRPPYARVPSRSSTTTPRVTTYSVNGSPALSHSQSSHRYHQTTCTNSPSSPRMTPRPTPQRSKEGVNDPARRTPVSSLLQEKLLKERQAETQKSAVLAMPSGASTDVNSSVELGSASHSSPIRAGEPQMHRPQSSNGTEGSSKKGMGVKDMEQVISTLHKQNFDLKLELYHRREKQSLLEERIEGLQAEQTQMEEMNDRLVAELEKRDKAVEEAVAMIVTLEAKVEQMASERRMVQQIEATANFRPVAWENELGNVPPAAEPPVVHRDDDNAKVINRMPSFMSEQSEATDNLRNVYLGVRGSVLSLSRVTEGLPDVDQDPHGSLVSPSLSVLSESSFMSVYGHKNSHTEKQTNPDLTAGFDGGSSKTRTGKETRPSNSRGTTTSKSSVTTRSSSFSRSNGAGNFQSIPDVIGQGSPLQRLERLDSFYQLKRDGARPRSKGRDLSASHSGVLPAQRRRKEEKREALRRVMTDTAGGVRLYDHGLPPTPDTISSSTLRRFKTSTDTLPQQRDVKPETSNGTLSKPADEEERRDLPPGVALERDIAFNATALGRQNDDFERSRPLVPPRPRSADETTVSNRRDPEWDSDSDARLGRHSRESSLDIWLREGVPASKEEGRVSPDLFGFPTSASRGDWAMDAMFGPGKGYSGGAAVGHSGNNSRDLFSAQQALYARGEAPPPPNRCSSLHARTGSASEDPSIMNQPIHHGKFHRSPNQRPRYSNRNSDDAQMRLGLMTPVQQQQYAPPPPPAAQDQKRSQYPPITGQHPARTGLNRLFRRSLGGGISIPVQDGASDPNVKSASPEAMKQAPLMGLPSWVSRNISMDDERDGATPPPIMRDPRHKRGSASEADSFTMVSPHEGPPLPETTEAALQGGYPPSTGAPRTGSTTATGSGNSSRRKWLPGFGRANSLKNKSG